MSDTAAIVSKGTPQTVTSQDFLNKIVTPSDETVTDESANDAGSKETSPAPSPEISEEALTNYFKSQGIDYEGVEKLKQKLAPPATTTQPTPEQIAEKEQAIERRMLDIHLKNGGSIEDFTHIKQAMNADTAEMSKALLNKELLDNGFSEEEAKSLSKQMFLQEELDSIEQGDDETTEEFTSRKAKLEKKVQYGASQLANRSLHIKTQAQAIFDNLKREVELEDLDLEKEAKFSATVESYVNSLPKSVQISIGEIDNKSVEPIEFPVPPEVHQEVTALFKDKQKRNEFFFNADGELNYENLMPLMVQAKLNQAQAKEAYLSGKTAEVKKFEQIFPHTSAQSVGVGGTPTKTSDKMGAPVSRGEAQKFQPIVKN